MWTLTEPQHVEPAEFGGLEDRLGRRVTASAATVARLPAGRQGQPARLFDGRQLIVQHIMFRPDWDEACPGCSFHADNIGHLAHLHARDTTFAAVSRAPLAKLEPFKARLGWTFP